MPNGAALTFVVVRRWADRRRSGWRSKLAERALAGAVKDHRPVSAG